MAALSLARAGNDARRAVRALEAVVGQDVGRNIAALVSATTGGLWAAASSIASHPAPRVVLLTGAFIPTASPPACETDGPVGTAVLAAGLRAVGVPLHVVTDGPCSDVVAAALDAAVEGVSTSLDVVPFPSHDASGIIENLVASFERMGVTHMVSIERIGPGADGRVRSMRAEDFTPHVAPLHRLYVGSGWTTIGIGDGGNEVGMGSLPHSLVCAAIEHGDAIHCTVPCDHLIVSGVSNWGALALLAALAVIQPSLSDGLLAEVTSPRHDVVLTAAVASGAVDGVLKQVSHSVDGLPSRAHHSVIESLRKIAVTARRKR